MPPPSSSSSLHCADISLLRGDGGGGVGGGGEAAFLPPPSARHLPSSLTGNKLCPPPSRGKKLRGEITSWKQGFFGLKSGILFGTPGSLLHFPWNYCRITFYWSAGNCGGGRGSESQGQGLSVMSSSSPSSLPFLVGNSSSGPSFFPVDEEDEVRMPEKRRKRQETPFLLLRRPISCLPSWRVTARLSFTNCVRGIPNLFSPRI